MNFQNERVVAQVAHGARIATEKNYNNDVEPKLGVSKGDTNRTSTGQCYELTWDKRFENSLQFLMLNLKV